MFQPLYVAATGLDALQNELGDVTNNLSNAKTVAFKKGRIDMENLSYVSKTFDQELDSAMARGEQVNPRGVIEYGTGVNIAATTKDFKQGTIDTTNNQLDLAIYGDGFFSFKMPDGSMAYSRAGNLKLDNEGNLVDPNGHLIEPSIKVPDGTAAISILQDGTVIALDSSSNQTDLGQISLTRFTNTQGLTAIGQNLFQATAASGEPQIGVAGDNGFGTINQYSLEASNVDVISEMMRMVMVQRIFDTVTKAVQSYESMLTSLSSMKQS
jgi:flagellar basal-body rod protein FlgG